MVVFQKSVLKGTSIKHRKNISKEPLRVKPIFGKIGTSNTYKAQKSPLPL
jgi:hypothetical protein